LIGAFVVGLRTEGFSDRELDRMLKENPARLLGLSVQ
jgi:predicted metal-dependent phosphotriesterase family hydrolase